MNQGTLILLLASVAFLGTGTFLLLPHRLGKVRPRTWHYAGAFLAAVGILLSAGLWAAPAKIFAALFFYGFGMVAVGAGVLMITSRSPVHSALWFAIVVLSTSGLFLLAGAQFLAAGTVIVYAGAIIVTFLFVIMLAQSEGLALYDRLSKSPARTSLVAFLLLLGVAYAVLTVKNAPNSGEDAKTVSDHLAVKDAPGEGKVARTVSDRDCLARPSDLETAAANHPELNAVLGRAQSPTLRMLPESSSAATNGFPPPHVAGLGASLFVDHLMSVEVAGAILFVALVGAVCIATPKPPVRPQVPPSTTA